MNIGIINSFVGGGGGTEKLLHAILEMLEKSNHNLTLYTFSKPKIKSKNIKIKTILPFTFPIFGLFQRAMEPQLISNAKNEDLLIQVSGEIGIPKSINQIIIVYCHTDFSNELENTSTKYKGLWKLYYKLYRTLVEKSIKAIDDPRVCLISNSKYIHDSIKEKYDENSEIIYPPVNLKEFQPTSKKENVVTVGRFSEEKYHDFGINVMKDLDCDYDIIGNTTTKSNMAHYEKLQNTIKNSHSKKINLLKNLKRDSLVEKINNSKIYFHCSNETFGISVVESIAAGCIPIVPNIGGHKETVPYDELRYLYGDVNDAQQKILDALSGKFDYLLPSLQSNIKKFDISNFQLSFKNYIESISSYKNLNSS